MISVIILTLNSANFIKPCLDSVLSQEAADIELIVVDNGSRDGTAGLVKKYYPGVKLIENRLNLGACAARNQGIEASRGEWVFTLDCDVVLERGFFGSIGGLLKGLPVEIGAVQPKILDFKGKRIYSAGISVSFLKRFFDIGRGDKDSGRFGRNKYIFGTCCAASFYRRQMLKAIGRAGEYFDREFFFLFEDVDLAWRARKKQYKALFYPQAVCYHRGNSSQTPDKTRQYLCLRNRYYTLLKNSSAINCAVPFLLYDLPRAFWLSLTNPSALRAVGELFIYAEKIRGSREAS
ncbi:MAG: glycosyltransferase family 2 protein [Candidatus Omnitrophica bacterium]|nr:glycosyltransferase family 2 protein [Candidatus Omnitrophota bacterium]MDD5771203.1 glycosyltransferase family 2 protein [Candidatus Omnitrophota bacterium]